MLAGIGGHTVDRQGLNAYVANSQAMNGLRSAQTDAAMDAARKSVDEATQIEQAQQAKAQASSKLTAVFPGHPEVAEALGNAITGGYGPDLKAAADGLLEGQQFGNRSTLGDASQLNTPQQTAAAQGISGKLEGPTAVPGDYTMPAGVTTPVQQTPLGAAQTSALNATSQLHTAQATDPAAFHTGSGVQLTDQQIKQYGHAMATLQMQMPTAYSIAKNPSLLAATQAALNENPTLAQADQHVQQLTLNDFAGQGINGRRTVAINTAVNHLSTAQGMVQALNNGDMQSFNRISNAWAAQTGDPAPTSMDMVGQVVGNEVMKAITNAGMGTGDERAGLQASFNTARSPQQMTDAITKAQQLLAGQASNLGIAYKAGTGRDDFNTKYLSPTTRAALNIQDVPVNNAPQATNAAPSAPAAGPAQAPSATAAAVSAPAAGPSATAAPGAAPRTVVRTGISNGVRVAQYSDGSIEPIGATPSGQ